MSYERRLEIEAMPAEAGWGKWVGVVGHATEFVERKEVAESKLWIYTAGGPQEITVHRYENWRFADGSKVVDKRWYTYTQWHDNYKYTDYFPRNEKDLSAQCAETREELVQKVRALLEKELIVLRTTVREKEALLSIFS